MFVKICGTTNEQDALLSVAMGADALGFIFAPSPRQVAPRKVADIIKRLPPEILTVGVFRDEATRRVLNIVNQTGLKGVQLHGREGQEETKWLRAHIPFVIKAFSAGDSRLANADRYGVDAVVIDNPTPGSGRVFDWKLAEGAAPGVPLILAGGLHADNVVEAIGQAHPWGVDVVTGVEATPGHKDPVKLRAFITAARSADPEPFESDSEAPYDWGEDQL